MIAGACCAHANERESQPPPNMLTPTRPTTPSARFTAHGAHLHVPRNLIAQRRHHLPHHARHHPLNVDGAAAVGQLQQQRVRGGLGRPVGAGLQGGEVVIKAAPAWAQLPRVQAWVHAWWVGWSGVGREWCAFGFCALVFYWGEETEQPLPKGD